MERSLCMYGKVHSHVATYGLYCFAQIPGNVLSTRGGLWPLSFIAWSWHYGNGEKQIFKPRNHYTLLNWNDWFFFLSFCEKYWYAERSRDILEIELTISGCRQIVLWTLDSSVSPKCIQLHLSFVKVIEDNCSFIVHSPLEINCRTATGAFLKVFQLILYKQFRTAAY